MDNHCVICGAYLADTGRMICPECEKDTQAVMTKDRKMGKGVKFQRIRRITGYLVGTLEKWNDAKKAEEKDRVKHSLGGNKNEK